MLTSYEEMVALGLHGQAPLKVILKGFIEDKVGVAAVVFATLDEKKAADEMKRLLFKKKMTYILWYTAYHLIQF